jgi:predicted MFS family arabinose efflux permease
MDRRAWLVVAGLALAAFVALWGATCSLPNQFVPLLLGGIVGKRQFAAAFGRSFVIYGMAGAAGPPVTGYLIDRTHGYTAPFLLAAALMFMSAVPAPVLRRLRNA